MAAPEFPGADPAIQYVVDRVSHIEDASYCAASYQASHKKLMQRLSKTDAELARMRQTTQDVREVLGEIRIEVINKTYSLEVAVGEMQRDQKTLLNSFCADFERLQQTQTEQQDEIALMLDRAKHTARVPFWQVGALAIICFAAGMLLGGLI